MNRLDPESKCYLMHKAWKEDSNKNIILFFLGKKTENASFWKSSAQGYAFCQKGNSRSGWIISCLLVPDWRFIKCQGTNTTSELYPFQVSDTFMYKNCNITNWLVFLPGNPNTNRDNNFSHTLPLFGKC